MICVRPLQTATLSGVLLFLASVSGCHSVTNLNNSVPANRLPRHFLSEAKECQTPVHFASLGQEKPAEHIVAAGDTLSVYIFGVFPSEEGDAPVVQRTQQVNQRYYPPNGGIVGPSTGLPITVSAKGTIELPIIGRFQVAGLSIEEIVDELKAAYREKNIVAEGKERVLVTLVIPRVTRVTVVREDTPNSSVALVSPGQVDHIHRGSGEVIDLPAYENDLMHALAATGGLPGTDADREVWVFRRRGLTTPTGVIPENLDVYRSSYIDGGEGCENVIRIPLTTTPGQPVPFSQQDVILEEGDVVYVPRRSEYFYTGGLLKGGRIPLPRDEDIDVLEAIALVTGSTGGPLGQSGQVLAGGSPGHMIKPTRVIILRTLPTGKQLPIRVDLARAMEDEKQRIFMQKDDVLMLHFKPHEAVGNAVLNLVSFPFTTITSN